MNLSSGYGEHDQHQISLAYLPPTPRQTRLALVGAAVLLLGFAALAPFAGKPLPQINVFIPALDGIIFVTELITASLFLAHFSITHSRALLVLGCGYLFSALIVVVHGLTFPGVFPTTGDSLSRTARVNFMIYLVWHLGLPVTLSAYVWFRDKDRPNTPASRTPTTRVAIGSVVGVFTLVGCLVWLAVAGDKLLSSPLNIFQPFPDPVTPWLINLTMLVCAAALFVLWFSRRSALDQWLMVVLLASMVELAITGRLGWHHFEHSRGLGSRFTLGFYTGRVSFSLLTSTVVLVALLAETTKLYAGVARANTLASAVKASQALSGEIELPKLIERLMTIAMKNAGADRGLLILPHENNYRVEAEALADGKGVAVRSRGSIDRSFPETIIRHTTRTQEGVILGDAVMPNLFSEDPYLSRRQPRSVLCLPLIRQGTPGGLLYLENTKAPHLFTPERAQLLELLASQAAISLQTAALYTDLQLQVEILQRLPVSAWTLKPDGTPDFVNQVWLEFAGQTLDFVRSHPAAWMSAIHPEDRELAAKSFWEGVHSGQSFAMATRSLRAQDAVYRWHLNQAVALRDAEGKVLKFVGTTTDIDDQKRTQEALRQAQGDLARINRVTTMGELAASLAHEIKQPIGGAITNVSTCLRKLGRDEPDLEEVRTVVARIGRDVQRAADIIDKIRSRFEKGALNQETLRVSDIIQETVALLRDEAVRHNISLRTDLAADLPPIVGDRVQLQQVAMNLIVNSIEAMKDVDGIRETVIRSQRAENQQILVSISDTGPGIPPQLVEQIFNPFFTTKPHGTGMGLRICRSIIESHGGRLWVACSPGMGATFHLSLPAANALAMNANACQADP
jgi:PAS domain S-box-containing protein